MLSELDPESACMLRDLQKSKGAARVKEVLITYGVEFDPKLSKDKLLKKLYLVLSGSE